MFVCEASKYLLLNIVLFML